VVCDDSAADVMGDRESLQLAVANLLHNAIEFSPRGGLVRLTASTVGTTVCIDVGDDGPGFAPFVQERIGERFISTPRPDGRPKGSGLGLAIARQVALLHGGDLRVECARAPTIVRLSIPSGTGI